MTPLHDLDESLAQLDPRAAGTYVFSTVDHVPEEVQPFAVIREDEGFTLIITPAEAAAHGLKATPPMRHIVLGAFTSVSAVGITATVSQTLASRSIACNVVAGYHHDHLFVPEDRAAEAMRLLHGLSQQAEGWLPEE